MQLVRDKNSDFTGTTKLASSKDSIQNKYFLENHYKRQRTKVLAKGFVASNDL